MFAIDELKTKLKRQAMRRYKGNIRPTSGRPTLDHCFSVLPKTSRYPFRLALWYNDGLVGSTHLETVEIPAEQVEYVRLVVAA